MHKLLQRQLRQARGDAAGDALDLEKLFALVDAAYCEVDRERRFMQHAYQVMRDEQATLADRQMRTHGVMTQIRAEKAEAERARAVAEAELLRQERLSVLGQLTATVAHELRNPLSSIRNSIHAIRELVRDKDLPLERPMSRIVRSIARCDGIISDLLEYARTRDLECADLVLDDWLGDILDEQRVPDGIVLERRLAASSAVVSIDDDRFRRVIINLFENAIQALHEDARAEHARRVTIATATAAGAAEIVIADTGPGIAPEILPRVFEPLFSTKSFGTGLGLPTVKQIVEQHGGTIAIASPPAAGATVSIRLPLAQAEAA